MHHNITEHVVLLRTWTVLTTFIFQIFLAKRMTWSVIQCTKHNRCVEFISKKIGSQFCVNKRISVNHMKVYPIFSQQHMRSRKWKQIIAVIQRLV